MSAENTAKPTAEEMASTRDWIASNLGREVSVHPFSFRYGDRTSTDFFEDCETEDSSEELDEHRTRRTLTYTDPAYTFASAMRSD